MFNWSTRIESQEGLIFLCYCSRCPVFKCQTAFSSVQSLSRVRLFVTPWTAACHAFLSITNSRSLLKLMSIKSVMPSNHLILGRPLLPLPSIFPSIRIFSNESVLCIRWPKYWSFSLHAKPDARVTPRWLKKHPDSCNSKTLCSHILPGNLCSRRVGRPEWW